MTKTKKKRDERFVKIQQLKEDEDEERKKKKKKKKREEEGRRRRIVMWIFFKSSCSVVVLQYFEGRERVPERVHKLKLDGNQRESEDDDDGGLTGRKPVSSLCIEILPLIGVGPAAATVDTTRAQ